METILNALKHLRVGIILDEYALQEQIAQVLSQNGIEYKKEYILGPRNRVDFLAGDGVAIEVKKGKPNRSQLISQVNRYAEFEEVKSVVIVVETSIRSPIHKTDNGKPCTIMGLRKLWGIAI